MSITSNIYRIQFFTAVHETIRDWFQTHERYPASNPTVIGLKTIMEYTDPKYWGGVMILEQTANKLVQTLEDGGSVIRRFNNRLWRNLRRCLRFYYQVRRNEAKEAMETSEPVAAAAAAASAEPVGEYQPQQVQAEEYQQQQVQTGEYQQQQVQTGEFQPLQMEEEEVHFIHHKKSRVIDVVDENMVKEKPEHEDLSGMEEENEDDEDDDETKQKLDQVMDETLRKVKEIIGDADPKAVLEEYMESKRQRQQQEENDDDVDDDDDEDEEETAKTPNILGYVAVPYLAMPATSPIFPAMFPAFPGIGPCFFSK